MNGYELSRDWFDWCFENPELHNTNHTALYMWICEKWNRLGQKEKFGLPTNDTMEVLNIKSKATYLKVFYELIDYGFIKLVSESKNQHASKVVSLCKKNTRHKNGTRTALDMTLARQANGTVPIIEQDNKEIKEQDNKAIPQQVAFDEFWELYEKKVDRKACLGKWGKLPYQDQCKIMQHLPMYVKSTPDKQYRKNPETYLNDNAWENEILTGKLPMSEKKENEVRPKGYPNPQSYYSTCWEKKIKPVRWENGDVLNDNEIEQQYKLHKVGPFQYA